MKIGIMGGAFDPIHIGHLIAADSAREQCGLDEVWFIPTAESPLKHGAPGANDAQRYEMVLAAIDGHPAFRALDLELKRGGVSYSFDTVSELRERYPGYEFSYIIGSDRVHDLAQWHRIGELAGIAGFIGLERPDEPLRTDSLPDFLQERLHLAEMPALGVSSTAIRRRLAAGRTIRYLVPDSVYLYIRRHMPYGSTRDD